MKKKIITTQNPAGKNIEVSIDEKEAKQIRQELKNIYMDGNGNIPPMDKLEIKKRSKLTTLLYLVIALLAIVAIASWSGFFIFQKDSRFSEDKIVLEIKSPFSVSAGQEISYDLRWINNGNIALSNCLLTVHLPNGFIYQKASREPINNDDNDYTPLATSSVKSWELSDLFPTEMGDLKITGIINDTIGSNQTISATLSYTPANFSSEFQKNSSFASNIYQSAITTEINAPSQVLNEEEKTYQITLKNNLENQLVNNIKLNIEYPNEFIVKEATIEQAENETITFNKQSEAKEFKITDLAPSNNVVINITGKFKANESNTFKIPIKTYLLGNNNEYVLQSESEINVEIVKGQLIPNLIISGSTKDQTANFGDTLSYLINLQNKSKNAFGNLKIRLVLNADFLDLKSFTDSNNGVVDGSQISWAPEQIPKLASLLPEEEINLEFTINVKSYNDAKSKIKGNNLKVQSFYEVQIGSIDTGSAEQTFESNLVTNMINTNLELSSQARYFNDQNETIGDGPIPPIVGQKTTYVVYWKINNSVHEIRDITLKANLPANITFEGTDTVPVGNLYLNNSNEIIWEISRLPVTVTESLAKFKISLTPGETDLNKILTILSEVTLTATDKDTLGILNRTANSLTTNLDFDPTAKNKGLIQKE